jgi:hypothetical protein
MVRRCRRCGHGAAAAFGLLNPVLAAFIHVSSELAFILNSARLLPGGREPDEGKRLRDSRPGERGWRNSREALCEPDAIVILERTRSAPGSFDPGERGA